MSSSSEHFPVTRKSFQFRRIACFLTIIMVLCTFTIESHAASWQKDVYTTTNISAICNAKNYIDGWYWSYSPSESGAATSYMGSQYRANVYTTRKKVNNGDTSIPVGDKDKNGKYYQGYEYPKGYWECYAFANYLGYLISGVNPLNGWLKMSEKDVIATGGLRVGDIVRSSSHSAMVYSISSDGSVKFVQCAGGYYNRISVNTNFNNKSNIKKLKDITNIDFILRSKKNTGASASQIYSNLEFQSVTAPINYKVGSVGGYPLTGGALVSNEELKTITSTIKKSDGAVISGPKTRNISGKVYSIVSLDTFENGDNGVKFSKITQSGNYVWILTATDASGKTLTLEMPFTASSNATTSTTSSIGWTAVTGVSLDKSSLELKINEAATLSATVSPANATNTGISWSSNNTAVATVDGNGTVSAVAPGTATITVTTADGGKKATCLVTVSAVENMSLADRIRIAILNDEYNPELDLNNDGKVNAQDYILAKKAELEPIAVPVTGIVWDTMEFRPGETGNVQYVIYPKDATNQSVYCDPYEDEICSVSADGRIYAKKNGYSYVCIHSAEDPNICVWGIICVHDPIQYIYEATVEPSGIIDIHFMATTNDKDKLSGFHLYQDNYNTHFVMQKSIIPDYNGPEIKEIQDDDWGSGQIFIVETNPRDNVIRADQEITYRLLPDNIDELWGTQQTYSFSFLPYYQYGVGHPYEKAKVNLSINVTFPEKDVPRTGIEQFVYRCYDIILGRQPDAGGMDTWVNELNSGRKAASEIIDNFVRSQEFLGKIKNSAEKVEILYKAMLGRGSDAPGKATWVGKLDAGYPLAVVINGFCGSKEFKEICDSYGIAPGSVSMEEGSASDQQIRAFVTRCYKIILSRDADEVGMNTWFNELKSRRRTAAEIIEQFVYSQEFQNRGPSNPDKVEILYKAMLGRGSDPAGKADWVGRLNNGQPLTAIINGFCGSMEFTAICEAYGITPGSVKVETVSKAAVEAPEETVQKPERKSNLIEITNPSDTVNEQLGTAVQAIYINEEKAKEFIGRCYQVILGREASQDELESWIGQMINGSKTADQIARGFLFSGEFKGRNIGNEELVKILYRVYMNREADPEGLATWTQKLDEGTSLNDLLDIFSKTNEFKAVIKNMAQ